MLHAHLPWVRDPERAGRLEEDWLFEALVECYLPLLETLDRLRADAVPFRLTLGLTPTLVSMLRDPLLRLRCERRLDALIELAAREERRTRRRAPELHAAARHYAERLPRLASLLRDRLAGDLLRGFAEHAREGGLELLAGAATHAFLPLLEPVPEAIAAQIAVGVACGEAALGPARGLWLPECGYAPSVEPPLRAAGIDYSFVESHGALLGEPAPSRGLAAPVVSPGGVAYFARDPISSQQVWSAESGYPGDPLYREFYRDVGWELAPAALRAVLGEGPRRGVGLKYHAVSGDTDLAGKQPWQPQAAAERARIHAAHFVAERRRQLAGLGAGPPPPLVVSGFDAELFGHWWYEGPCFLEAVFRELARGGEVEPVTPALYLERHPQLEVCQPERSSWGREGQAAVWLDPSNDWIPPRLIPASRELTRRARAKRRPSGRERRALDQAARELLLAQASDWAFMLSTGASADYGRQRVRDHLAAFEELLAGPEPERLERLEARHPIFPGLDHRAYA